MSVEVVNGGHVIQWEFDYGTLRGICVCREAPDADCRLMPTECACEEWVLQRDGRGAFHMIEDARHDMKPGDYCNVELFLNEDEVTEMYEGRFVIGETVVKPVWMGDYCDWEPA